MDDSELRDRVLAFVRDQSAPVVSDAVIKHLVAGGAAAMDVRKALWWLLDNRQIHVTPDRKLEVAEPSERGT